MGHSVLCGVEYTELGFVRSHPSDKDKNVARVGHPIFVLGSKLRRFVKQRSEHRKERAGDDGGAFRGWMDAIILDRSGDMDQIFVEHGHQSDVVLRREIAKNFIE